MQASGIPSPRYEWFYRPNDDPNTPGEDFVWTPLSATQDNVLYFDPFTFSDSGYYYCRISHNLCVVAEVTKGKLDDYFTSKKIFLRPERGSLVISRCSIIYNIIFPCAVRIMIEMYPAGSQSLPSVHLVGQFSSSVRGRATSCSPISGTKMTTSWWGRTTTCSSWPTSHWRTLATTTVSCLPALWGRRVMWWD